MPLEPTRCENKEPHYFHQYQKLMVHQCSGMTACGVVTHAPHGFDGMEELWCPGICDCGLTNRGLHGPGEHK
jgi:hypothetical protein